MCLDSMFQMNKLTQNVRALSSLLNTKPLDNMTDGDVGN